MKPAPTNAICACHEEGRLPTAWSVKSLEQHSCFDFAPFKGFDTVSAVAPPVDPLLS